RQHSEDELLRVFEQCCQAVAYAHTRGVVHRDLKPANVMVGEFGEVLVVDWGLAKFVGLRDVAGIADDAPDAATRHGTVLGTPAYMAPEQAAGQTARVGLSTDVFGLGAILCEILTGAPPFLAGRETVADGATIALELGDCHARLQRCDAPPPLVRLALDCLQREIDARPTNAGEVAARVAGYRTGVAQRLRAVELECAAAEAAARSERRTRRVSLVAAVTILVLVVAGGIGWRALELDRLAELERKSSGIRRAVQVATRLFGEAASTTPQDPAGYRTAAIALEPAASQAADADADVPEELRNDVAELAQQIRQGLELAEADVARRRGNARLLQLFDEIDQTDSVEVQRSVAMLQAGFETEGLHPFEGDLDAAVAALRRRGIDRQLAAALDAWAMVLLVEQVARDPAKQTRLLTLADRIDPDPWRSRIRAAVQSAAPQRAFHDLLVDPELPLQPPNVVATVVTGATYTGRPRVVRSPGDDAVMDRLDYDRARVESVLRQALRNNPGAHELNYQLAELLGIHTFPPRAEEGIGYARAVVAVRPDFRPGWFLLAGTLGCAGQREEAIEWYRRVLGARPDHFKATFNVGTMLLELHRYADALPYLEAAVTLREDKDPFARLNLANALMNIGRTAEGLESYRRAELLGNNPIFSRDHALALELSGDTEGALQVLRQAVEKHLDGRLPIELARLLIESGKLDEAIDCARRAVSFVPDSADAHYQLGRAFEAAGEIDDALACFRRAERLAPEAQGPALMIANIHRRRGHLTAAVEAYTRNLAAAERRLPQRQALPRRLLALTHALGGHLDEAVRESRRGLAAVPGDVGLRENLVLMLEQQGNHEPALDLLLESGELCPEASVFPRLLAEALLALDRRHECLEPARAAVDLDDNADTRRTLGIALAANGKWQEAIREFERALQHDADDARSSRRLSWCRQAASLAAGDSDLPFGAMHPESYDEAVATAEFFAGRGEFAEAADLWGVAITLDPQRAADPNTDDLEVAICRALAASRAGDDGAAAAMRGRALGWLRTGLDRVQAMVESGDSGESEERIRALLLQLRAMPCTSCVRGADLEALPPSEQSPWQVQWARVDELLARIHERRWSIGPSAAQERAAAEASRARLNEKEQQVAVDEAFGLYRSGLADQAAEALERVLAAAPECSSAWCLLGIVNTARSRFEAAVVAFERAVEFGPESPFNWASLGKVLLRVGRIDDSIAANSRALDLDPSQIAVYQRREITLVGRGGLPAVLAAADALVAEHPGSSQAHWNRGRTLMDCARDREGALAEFRRSYDLQPEFFPACALQGHALLRLGRFAEARDAFLETRRINGSPDFMQEAIERTERFLGIEPAYAAWRVGAAPPADDRVDDWIMVAFLRDDLTSVLALVPRLKDPVDPEIAKMIAIAAMQRASQLPVESVEAAEWRTLSLLHLQHWLEAKVAVLETNLSLAGATELAGLMIRLEFSLVQDPAMVEALPEPERGGWRTFCDRVRSVYEGLLLRI
ncbi:MAG: tetratricopeptide repeat protein, partial [Planctomycetes bacterium]|nr:tetratricopeptide repeat protein [Planctomycetota bacterium]